MKPLRIMVVDDSLVAAQLLKHVIECLGHTVPMIAKSGAEAIAGYWSCNPDLVTMDITMPGMTGIEAAEKIIKSDSSARIIMVTSHAQKAMIEDAIKIGAKGYILKPAKADALETAIKRAVGQQASAA